MFIISILCGFYLVDQPDLVIPEHGRYNIQLRFGPVGEIIGYGCVDLFDRLSVGVSYGAANLIGAGNPEFYKQPGVQIRCLVLSPSIFIPGIMVGFDNQGYGSFDSSRYDIMSKGLYCQFAEVFDYPGLKIVPNIGINYCFERDDRVDIFSGVRFEFGSSGQLLIDYSPNFNDPEDQDKGYLNLGLRFVFYEQLFFEFALRDLLDNSQLQNGQLNRMIKIGYKDIF